MIIYPELSSNIFPKAGHGSHDPTKCPGFFALSPAFTNAPVVV
jgi:hypothetical protein